MFSQYPRHVIKGPLRVRDCLRSNGDNGGGVSGYAKPESKERCEVEAYFYAFPADADNKGVHVYFHAKGGDVSDLIVPTWYDRIEHTLNLEAGKAAEDFALSLKNSGVEHSRFGKITLEGGVAVYHFGIDAGKEEDIFVRTALARLSP